MLLKRLASKLDLLFKWTKIGVRCLHSPNLALMYNYLNLTAILQLIRTLAVFLCVLVKSWSLL